VHFVYYYPKAKNITSQQKEYIQSFMDSFEETMHSEEFNDPQNGYASYIDVGSFIDYFLLSELSRNVDGYKKSRYFYKNKESINNKLYSGPAWDYDWAWKNIYDCEVYSRTDGSGWSYTAGNNCNQDIIPPVYVARLLEDSIFRNKLKTRYVNLRKSYFSENYIFNHIDSSAAYLYNSQKRHYEKWDILGDHVGAPEVDEIPDTFEGEIEKMKNWISLRLLWLDENMPGLTDPSYGIAEHYNYFRIFPNPTSNTLYVESNNNINSLTIYNLAGISLINKKLPGLYSCKLDVGSLSKGFYFLKITTNSGLVKTEKIIVN
jgi:hypothetical protein